MKTKHTIWAACAASLIAFGSATTAFAAQPEGLQGVAAAERYRGAQEATVAIPLPAVAAAAAGRALSERGVVAVNVESQLRFRGDNVESQVRFRGDNVESQVRFRGDNTESQLRFRGDNTESQLRFRGDNLESQVRFRI